MNAVIDLVRREPAVIIALVDAAIVLAVTFGLPLEADQKAAIDGLLAAALAVAAGIVTRSQVTPVVKLPPGI